MTISNTTNRKTFGGNGITTAFDTNPVVFYDTSDLDIYVVTNSTGGVATLTLDTHCAVTGGDGNAGTVDLTGGSSPYGAPAAGTTLVISRNVPSTQLFDPENNDASDAEALERALDRQTVLIQQLESKVQRSVRLADSDVSGADPTLPQPEGGTALGWGVGGSSLINIALATGTALVDLATSAGSALIGWIQSGVAAAVRSVRDKLREQISVKDFGAVGDGVTDDTAAINAAIAEANTRGGGIVFFPAGTYATGTGIVLGNGSNSAPSTVHNRITLRGEGYGSSTGIINQQVNGASRILYTGSTSASAAVLTLAGPMYGVKVEDITLDCDSKAGRGIIVNHVTQATFKRVSCRNYRAIGFDLTCRTGFPVGCAFGNGDNRFYDCYGFLDSASLSSLDIIGVSLNSGVSTAVSLAGQPDSARNVFIGGTFIYGTTANSHGFYLSGADNNVFIECLLYPYGGATLGYDVWLQQWAASGSFPHENHFQNLGMTRGVSGNGGVGSGWGNTFSPFPTSDGAAFPTITGASGITHVGHEYVAGSRVYRSRTPSVAALNGTVVTNATTSRVNVAGLSASIVTREASKVKAHFSGRVSKSTAGTGNFGLALNGSFQGDTFTDYTADGIYHTASAVGLFDVSAGTQTVTVQFQSSDTSPLLISHGTLVVEEMA